ncbi:ATP-dependent DNA ligase [Alkaliphilus serpentinus]|uniref:ATP-dependent DNA ligase n=1 Tax=Alkaliphilus serpentinus TaxID=1482731 RepID=A0A833HLP1_9FIRM|nr:ATP-dependent DNA ligase [Alkaliphilus serpentinus]KAB3526335.1 ATP-dependent DNA ligase [Alkaliphilus serpentinus]
MFFKPMLLETAPHPFNSTRCYFEMKYDGIRLEYSNIQGFNLYTRNGNLVTSQFPELAQYPLPGVVLDGEAIVEDCQGKDDFEGIIKRLRLKKKDKIEAAIMALPVTYYVFDVLYNKGEDLRQKPLTNRKAILREVLKASNNTHIRIVDWIDTQGEELFRKAQDHSMEGIIAKEKSSQYLSRRSNKWLKIINWLDLEGVIYGYRKEDHALLCKDDKGLEIGVIHQGMTPDQRRAFLNIAKDIKVDEDKKAVFIEPLLRCKLKGRGFTSSGMVRSPVFMDFIL